MPKPYFVPEPRTPEVWETIGAMCVRGGVAQRSRLPSALPPAQLACGLGFRIMFPTTAYFQLAGNEGMQSKMGILTFLEGGCMRTIAL